MKEFDLIASLIPRLPTNPSVLVGAGDDCAIVDLGIPDRLFLLKTDAVVENVHFTAGIAPERVGHKALARACSDIAAMGGKPLHALVTLGLPAGFTPDFVNGIYSGLNALATRFAIAIVGGETTRSESGVFVSIALVGSVPRGKQILRSGAKPGDAIFVTGELGGSIEGKHLDFEPRVQEGQWLAGNLPISAMIDLSDGLASDLRRILECSGGGAELLEKSMPVSRAAKLRARRDGGKPAALAALTDGEDFELLFTVPKAHAVKTLDMWKAQFPSLRLTCIGQIRPEPGVTLRGVHGTKELNADGYDHFA